MPLHEVTIDPHTWEQGTEARRGEWRTAIRELVEAPDLVIREDARRLQVRVTEQSVLLTLWSEEESELLTLALPHTLLAAHIAEYVDIVRQISRDDGSGLSRLEALDMAKKVVHDRAGRTLRRACRDLGVDLATARRLYTLILTLKIDTTRLVGVHGHRRIR